MTWTRGGWVVLRLLAVCYAIGFALHALDVLGLRLPFSRLPFGWKAWILYLLVFDLAAAVGLWRGRVWGIALFVIVAVSQLVAYLAFTWYFGPHTFLVGFHLVTLAAAAILVRRSNDDGRARVDVGAARRCDPKDRRGRSHRALRRERRSRPRRARALRRARHVRVVVTAKGTLHYVLAPRSARSR